MEQAKRTHQRALRAAHFCQHPAVHRPARRARPEGVLHVPFARARATFFAAVVRVPRVALGLSADVGGVRLFLDADRVWFPR